MKSLFGMKSAPTDAGDSSVSAATEIERRGTLDLEIPSSKDRELGALMFVLLFLAAILALFLCFVLVPWGGVFGSVK